jgi:hypothetical protein
MKKGVARFRGPSCSAPPGEAFSPAAAGGSARAILGDLDIRITSDGAWYYHGTPIDRKELVCLFASALRVDDAGEYWLVTPVEFGRITVDDAPFAAVELFSAGAAAKRVVSVRTNVDEIVTIDHDHLLRVVVDPASGEPSPYVTVRPKIEARLTRSVYYQLVELGTEEVVDNEHVYGVWSSGTFFPIGPIEPRP